MGILGLIFTLYPLQNRHGTSNGPEMGREVRIGMLEPRGGAWGHREGVGGNIGPRTKFVFVFFNNRQNPNDMTKVSELLPPPIRAKRGFCCC